MNSTPEPAPNTFTGPLPDFELLVAALRNSSRWIMLKELTCGETRTVDEMARLVGCGYDNAAKHLKQLVRSGLVVRARGRVYQMNKAYLPVPGQPVVDCGLCLLRLDAIPTAKPG